MQRMEESVPGYYDMIFMDIMMPEMDGLEATRTIRNLDREDCKKIPIYAMSANAFDEDVKRSLASGMNGHLSKPVNLQVLEKTLLEKRLSARCDENKWFLMQTGSCKWFFNASCAIY